MSKQLVRLGFLGAMLASSAMGCGGGGGATPIIGSWRNTSTPSADITSGTRTYTFNADGTFREEVNTMWTATAASFAGCAQRGTTSGTYVVSGSAVNFTVTTFGLGYMGCTDAMQNVAFREESAASLGTAAMYTQTFAVSGTMLTLTSADGMATGYVMQ